jgi:hypothetical protein
MVSRLKTVIPNGWSLCLNVTLGSQQVPPKCRCLPTKLYGSSFKKVALDGLVVSVLATGPKVRGFDPDRSTTSFGGEVKPSVPCRRFTACKRTLRAWIEMFRKQNSAAISHPSLLTACQIALEVTSGLSRTCAVSGLVTHYINAHGHRNLRKEAPMVRQGQTNNVCRYSRHGASRKRSERLIIAFFWNFQKLRTNYLKVDVFWDVTPCKQVISYQLRQC